MLTALLMLAAVDIAPDPDYCQGIACTEETDTCCDWDAP